MNSNTSIEKLAIKYKIGKIKVKQILSDNSVEIKHKGGQQKHIFVPFKYDLTNKSIECKVCGKVYNDVENKSGSIVEHMKTCYPTIEMPSKLFRSNYKNDNGEYWHFQYFNIIEKPENTEVLKCPECDWYTTDLTNKTGSFTKHVEKQHNSVELFTQKYPYYNKYFNIHKLNSERLHKLHDDKNYVICQICGEKLKIINNTHIKTHNICVDDYKMKYYSSKITSDATGDILRKNMIITNTNMTPNWSSNGETEIANFINSLNIETDKSRNRKLLNGKEIDIVIKSHNLCIEHNGIYYHTERMGKNSLYHLNKTIDCNNIGYRLIHIFEDEWVNKKEIVKSKLKHILNVNDSIKIGARQTIIRKINKNEKITFLNENHIQGNDNSNIFFGAYYNNVLVGVATFNSKRNMTKNILGEFELSRFATKMEYIVCGLLSKMIKVFISEYKPKHIISFADRRWTMNSENNLYIKLGFKLEKITKPTYYYFNPKISRVKRFHKFGFGKKSLKKKFPDIDMNLSENEITKLMGYDRIWDCGLFKYRLTIEKGED